MEGNQTAFRQLVNNYKNKVYNTVLGILQDEDEAEDVTQEVFIKIFESISGFKGGSKLSTWIYRIAVTQSLEYLRKKKRKKRFAFVYRLMGEEIDDFHIKTGDFIHPGVKLENKEQAGILFRAIEDLPENQKTAFTLNKVEGLSYQEVGEVMEISLASVESLIFRARNNLKKQLEPYYKK